MKSLFNKFKYDNNHQLISTIQLSYIFKSINGLLILPDGWYSTYKSKMSGYWIGKQNP